MATVACFEELQVWQDARELVKAIYSISKQGSFRRDASLRDQIRRAATSVMSNIAEGFERGTRKEFIHFLDIAKGSNGEVRSQLYVALDQAYTDQNKFDVLCESTKTLSRRIATFVAYLQNYRGNRRARGTP
jgi:four helix bundle protein